MHHSKFVALPLNIILDPRLQCIYIQTVFVQGVKDLLFKRERCCSTILRGLFVVLLHVSANLYEEVDRDIGDTLECRGLEVLEAGVVEDFANGLLKRLSIEPWGQKGAVF